MIYRIIGKRVFDVLFSIIGLVVFSPVFLALIILVKIDSKGPAFFKQRRIGKNKCEFMILKFRTMRGDTPQDIPTHLLQNPAKYITKIGWLLRKSSLDELPQILNILKGDMSIVGPRPALWNQYNLIAERDKYGANNILPGLTGWAQVNGRDELPIPVKAGYDGEYVDKLGMAFDIKILIKTVGAVFKAAGVKEGKSPGIGC